MIVLNVLFGRVVGCCFQGQLIPIWLKWVLYIGCCTAGYSASPSLSSLCKWIPASHNPPCFIWNTTKWIKTTYGFSFTTNNPLGMVKSLTKQSNLLGTPEVDLNLDWQDIPIDDSNPNIPSSHRWEPPWEPTCAREGWTGTDGGWVPQKCLKQVEHWKPGTQHHWVPVVITCHYVSLLHPEVSMQNKTWHKCFAPRGVWKRGHFNQPILRNE